MKQAIHSMDSKAISSIKTLVVDDDRSMCLMLQSQLEELGYVVTCLHDGQSALDVLNQNPDAFDIILLDRQMPGMDGMEVIKHIKRNEALKDLLIIMQTGSDQPEQIKEGIDAGVFYYLTKPIDEDVLNSVLSAAAREAKQKNTLNSELQQHKHSFSLIKRCDFTFKTLNEAESLACFIANCYPNPKRVVSGLAELLVNAVEHGNLAISYDEKSLLIKENKWLEEIHKRQELPEFQQKNVDVLLENQEKGITITITDQGKGFNWHKYLQIDPARAKDNHGRGIAQANATSFDRLIFNETGNQAIAFVSNEAELEW